MIGDMSQAGAAPTPEEVVAAIAAAVAASLGEAAGRYRVTSIRPLGWAEAAGGEERAPWGLWGRWEAGHVRQGFGEGRRV